MRPRLAPATLTLIGIVCGLGSSGVAAAQQLDRRSPQPLVVPPVASPADGAAAPALLPPGFLDTTLPLSFNQAVGMTVGPDERLYVWERSGKVWFVEDGVKHEHPLLDISEEVALWGDYGLLGFALDPDYLSNGFIYVLYVVDYHHLVAFGTPAYDPQLSIDNHDTIARLTRYRVDLTSGFHEIVPGSRHVLIGEDIGSGFPICGLSHGAGTLAFGDDGTLLVSFGDGHGPVSSGTCLEDGILSMQEDVGAWRAQLVNSLAGKIVRVSPETGDGLPSNPFYDPLAPRAPRSRVWALGLRNPYRFALRPGTGASDPAVGDPGTLLIGDVGEGLWEELNVARVGGVNFGWPMYEGMDLAPADDPVPFNLNAPNPLFGINACAEPYFAFDDLIVPDGLLPPSWPNPCDPFVQVPLDVPTFQHARPVIDWSHDGVSRVALFDHQGAPISQPIGDTSPVPGPQFGGASSTGGAWMGGTGFPAPYGNTWFHADFGAGWIHSFEFDADDNPTEVHSFAQAAGAVVAVASDDVNGLLYYINYLDPTVSTVHEIRYVPGNLPPTAVIALDTTWGAEPLVIRFDGSGSSDPEGGALSWLWDFGDGTPASYQPSPVHVFPSVDISAQGTIIASVDTLSPPQPMGLGNLDKNVIRDGDIPPPGTSSLQRQYDTVHFGPGFVPDKGEADWIGYTFPVQHSFHALLFQEGMQIGNDGGWFDSFTVQVRVDGTWQDVTDLVITPAYVGKNLPTFEIFELSFAPTTGDGIRLHGDPGGLFDFISVGELRVVAAPLAWPGLPAKFDVTLQVSDPLATVDVTKQAIWVDNTPPHVQILYPPNADTYSDDQMEQVALLATADDAEHHPDDLTCEWQVFLHHNDHVHPDPADSNCSSTGTLLPHGVDGDVHYYEVRFSATDPLGLTGSVSHYLLPDDDLNLNGIADALDIANGTSEDSNGNGVPDEAEIDCNGNGLSDLLEVTVGLVADRDGNGVPDSCDPAWLHTLPEGGVPLK